MAKREVPTFVALALDCHEINLAPGNSDKTRPSFLRCDMTMPSLGVMPPVPGDVVHIVIKKRVNVFSRLELIYIQLLLHCKMLVYNSSHLLIPLRPDSLAPRF